MSFPFVSRRRYEELELELARVRGALEGVEWYRERIEALEDQVTRIVRRQAGMTEEPATARPKPEPMPSKLRDFIRDFDDDLTRGDLIERAERMHRLDGESWQAILTRLKLDFGMVEAP